MSSVRVIPRSTAPWRCVEYMAQTVTARYQSTLPSTRNLFSAVPVEEDDYDDNNDYDYDSSSEHKPLQQHAASPRPIYVSATRQHTGKTSVSLALVSGLQKRFEKVGFMKPVGQQSVHITDDDQGDFHVDKDVAVVKELFDLHHLSYRHMSPVLIPKGYTKDYLNGHISHDWQRLRVEAAYQAMDKMADVMLCEGTGHCAVGSIVEASNAQVASWLNASMVLVANGGIGSAFDDLALNRMLCDVHGVDVAGVIVNRVKHDKYDQTKEYLTRVLEERWGVPLLGCVPDRPYLGCPALADLEFLFQADLLSGSQHRMRHYSHEDLHLVATSLPIFLHDLRVHSSRTLYVCHSSRDDIIMGFLMEYERRLQEEHPSETMWKPAMVICGTEEFPLSEQVLDIVENSDAPPILAVRESPREVMERVHKYTPKLNSKDSARALSTAGHYEPYIDFDLLLQRTGNTATLSEKAESM